MPNGLTDRQVEELNRAAKQFAEAHGEDLAVALPSLVVREANGETVFLYEKVEASLSKLRPTNREERRANGERFRALDKAWARDKKAALKRARSS